MTLFSSHEPANGTSSSSSSGDGADDADGGDGRNPWAEAAEQLRAEGWPLAVVKIVTSDARGGTGGGGSSDGSSGGSGRGGGVVRAVDSGGAWRRLQNNACSPVVLVRPDGHVAWRALRLPQGGGGGGREDGGRAAVRQACRERLEGALQSLGWLQGGSGGTGGGG
jgi:hypothetical protein